MTGRKNPIFRTRLDSNSIRPRATTDLPLLGSMAAMYRLFAIFFDPFVLEDGAIVARDSAPLQPGFVARICPRLGKMDTKM